MGERLTLGVYKGQSKQQFRSAVEAVVSSHGGRINWDTPPAPSDIDCRTSHTDDVHVIYLPYLGGFEYLLCRDVAKHLACPWIELRAQEGSLWDLSAYRGDQLVDRFSVDPNYWDESPAQLAAWIGHPNEVAKLWGIDVHTIERYMVNWKPQQVDDDSFEYARKGKANAHDEHEYGDIWQMYDFLRALGGRDPLNTTQAGMQHRLHLPRRGSDSNH